MYRYKQPRNISIMNPEDYVSYPIALALKKAGFDEPCDHYYCTFDNETDVRFWSIHPAQSQNGLRTPNDTVVADAPTLAVAQKWLREKKKIDVLVWNCACGYGWEVSKAENGTGLILFDDKGDNKDSGCWTSYESALSAGIAAALELIGEKGE